MLILSQDNDYIIDVGSNAIVPALYTTIDCRLEPFSNQIKDAVEFLKTGKCTVQAVGKISKQLKIIQNELSKIPPTMAIYPKISPIERTPWENGLSDNVKSCLDLWTTVDGKNLIGELIKLFSYAEGKHETAYILEE